MEGRLVFKITSFGELSGWRPIEMDMPLVSQWQCPCDGEELSIACLMLGTDLPARTFSVGACMKCGYVGYIHRPTKQWFADFYASEWDANARDDQEEVRRLVRSEVQLPQPALGLVRSCCPKPTDKILEFGCGYGLVLQQLIQHGFKNVSGVEPCQHRAKIAASELCLDVHCGELSAMDGKYDLIYSTHVLEHCYDPSEVIGQCARLQVNGGKLAINVPDAAFEPTMGQILFLPHVHSFTEVSLANLFAKHGYEVFTTARDGAGLIVIGMKTGRSIMRQFSGDATISVVEKFVGALDYHIQIKQPMRFMWNSANDECGICDQKDWDMLAPNVKRPRYINVEPCAPITGHPVEIQFKGPVMLCVK